MPRVRTTTAATGADLVATGDESSGTFVARRTKVTTAPRRGAGTCTRQSVSPAWGVSCHSRQS